MVVTRAICECRRDDDVCDDDDDVRATMVCV